MRWTFLALLAACYAPHPPEGAPCGGDGACPDPLTCIRGACVSQAPACTPIEDGSGHLTVPTLSAPLAIDGDLDDWPTCFVTVDTTTAGLVRDEGANGRFATGQFSVAADATHLYVAAAVSGVLPLGDQPPPDVYENNAISVYFDGGGSATTAAYPADAAQIVVDHAGREQAFRSGSTVVVTDLATGVTSAGSATFSIEMAVEPGTFGLAAFGATIGFDIGIVGGNGSALTSELLWFQRCTMPACECSDGSAAPYCDAREFGAVVIAP